MELRTRIVDYTVKDATGEVVSGSKTAEKFLTYEWTLIRSKDSVTPDKEALKEIHARTVAQRFISTTAASANIAVRSSRSTSMTGLFPRSAAFRSKREDKES